jgi:Fe-S-cluster containining protein
MNCRPGCGACCIAPSISSPIPGMPKGKPADLPCLHLTADYGCAIFLAAERPTFCAGLRADFEMCGADREAALAHLRRLERLTLP